MRNIVVTFEHQRLAACGMDRYSRRILLISEVDTISLCSCVCEKYGHSSHPSDQRKYSDNETSNVRRSNLLDPRPNWILLTPIILLPLLLVGISFFPNFILMLRIGDWGAHFEALV